MGRPWGEQAGVPPVQATEGQGVCCGETALGTREGAWGQSDCQCGGWMRHRKGSGSSQEPGRVCSQTGGVCSGRLRAGVPWLERGVSCWGLEADRCQCRPLSPGHGLWRPFCAPRTIVLLVLCSPGCSPPVSLGPEARD